MKIIGIIAEYNPLHLGHIYQIEKAKELYPNSIIIVITSTYFSQRGEPIIINKWNKTKICLENNIDLIIELPFAYATQSADVFAKGALKILNILKIDTLIFSSESNNIEKLTNIANTQLNNHKYQSLVKKHLNTGLNYPTAISKALEDILGYTITKPNDLLGLSYIKEIILNNYPITPITIKRIGNYHEKEITQEIISASLIRKLHLQNKDISPYIPTNTKKYLYYNLSNETYYKYLQYKILSTSDLSKYQTVDEGIENRIKKAVKISNNWEELIENIKTKRYTYNKINRMLIHILTDFTKEEAQQLNINYIKLLGFSINGQKYLNSIKKKINLPIITNYQKKFSKLLDLELRVASIYYLPINPSLLNKEFKNKPIKKN